MGMQRRAFRGLGALTSLLALWLWIFEPFLHFFICKMEIIYIGWASICKALRSVPGTQEELNKWIAKKLAVKWLLLVFIKAWDRFGGNQGCLDLSHFCRLASIELHLNPHRVPEESPAERAASCLEQVGAPSHTEPLHLVSQRHWLLSCHMPLAGCVLGKHSEFPRGRELVDHIAGQSARNRTVTRVENMQTRVFMHAWVQSSTWHLFCSAKINRWR